MAIDDTSRPTGSRESRRRIWSQEISTFFGPFFASPPSFGSAGGACLAVPGAACEGDGSAGCAGGFAVSSLKRSRNWSSLNFGTRWIRSTRASCGLSVRCDVSKSRNVPSGLHATFPIDWLARNDAW